MSDLPRQPSAPIQAAPRRPSFAGRQGYQARFLGPNLDVPLPAITGPAAHNVLTFRTRHGAAGHRAQVHPLLGGDELGAAAVLLLGREHRRQAVGGAQGQAPVVARRPAHPQAVPGNRRVLRLGAEGKFSRGHMTRREDPNWGPDAAQANTDTFHATNAVPADPAVQRRRMERSGGLRAPERAARCHAHLRDDRAGLRCRRSRLFGVAVPVRFWKVIAFVHDQTGRLCATGYTMSQRERLAGLEFVYGGFQTYQRAWPRSRR